MKYVSLQYTSMPHSMLSGFVSFLAAEKVEELFEFMALDIKLFSQVLSGFDAASPN